MGRLDYGVDVVKVGLIILWLAVLSVSGAVYTEEQALLVIAVAIGGPTLFACGLWGLGMLIHGKFWEN